MIWGRSTPTHLHQAAPGDLRRFFAPLEAVGRTHFPSSLPLHAKERNRREQKQVGHLISQQTWKTPRNRKNRKKEEEKKTIKPHKKVERRRLWRYALIASAAFLWKNPCWRGERRGKGVPILRWRERICALDLLTLSLACATCWSSSAS